MNNFVKIVFFAIIVTFSSAVFSFDNGNYFHVGYTDTNISDDFGTDFNISGVSFALGLSPTENMYGGIRLSYLGREDIIFVHDHDFVTDRIVVTEYMGEIGLQHRFIDNRLRLWSGLGKNMVIVHPSSSGNDSELSLAFVFGASINLSDNVNIFIESVRRPDAYDRFEANTTNIGVGFNF